MDYLQLKYSVEKLTECLKVLPKEDRKPLNDLMSVYKNKLKSINYIDESNTFFDKKEIRHINQFMSRFIERTMKPYREKIDIISEKISIDCGHLEASKQPYIIYKRICKISEYLGKKNFKNPRVIEEQLSIKSRVFEKANKNFEKKEQIFWDLLDENTEYLEAEKKAKKMSSLINDFELDLPIKNLIAYRSRNMKEKQTPIDSTIRESIQIEIEKQWLKIISNQVN